MFFFKSYKFEREYMDSASLINRADDVAPIVEIDYGDDYEARAVRLEAFKPDTLGLSVISLSISEAIKTTAFLRGRFDLPILWGGVGTILEPEVAIEHADLVCVGEGEGVMVAFAGRLALQLITKGDYQIMSQRGCPFSCAFCVESRYQEMFGKKRSLRRRNIDVVLEELVQAKEQHNPGVIWFWDDVFTLNPRWLNEFLPRYKAEVGIHFWCYTDPITHKLELLLQLKEAGGNCLLMGIQSGSERILEEVYNRPTPLGRVIEASQEIVEAGIVGYFDLISNSSFETEEDLRSTFNFPIELPQELVYLGRGDMKSYPTYSYTRNEEVILATNVLASTVGVTKEVYDYYHNLYRVARNRLLDKEEKLKIGSECIFRETRALLNEYI
jgi:radical SAM superfamily enzyme YgiQ (UPF0313 family)